MAIRRVMLFGTRSTGITSLTGIGTGGEAFLLGSSTTGGFTTHPIRIPHDFDVSRQCMISILAQAFTGPGIPGEYLDLRLNTTWGSNTADMQNDTRTFVTIVPDAFTTARPLWIPFSLEGDWTTKGGIFQKDGYLAFQPQRAGGTADDTYASSIRVATCVALDYHQLCQFGTLT